MVIARVEGDGLIVVAEHEQLGREPFEHVVVAGGADEPQVGRLADQLRQQHAQVPRGCAIEQCAEFVADERARAALRTLR
jgi:hypothetical protein